MCIVAYAGKKRKGGKIGRFLFGKFMCKGLDKRTFKWYNILSWYVVCLEYARKREDTHESAEL